MLLAGLNCCLLCLLPAAQLPQLSPFLDLMFFSALRSNYDPTLPIKPTIHPPQPHPPTRPVTLPALHPTPARLRADFSL